MVAVSVSSVYAGARVCFTTDSSQCVSESVLRQWVRVKEYDEPSSNKYILFCLL